MQCLHPPLLTLSNRSLWCRSIGSQPYNSLGFLRTWEPCRSERTPGAGLVARRASNPIEMSLPCNSLKAPCYIASQARREDLLRRLVHLFSVPDLHLDQHPETLSPASLNPGASHIRTRQRASQRGISISLPPRKKTALTISKLHICLHCDALLLTRPSRSK
jgi:hypothetical protein